MLRSIQKAFDIIKAEDAEKRLKTAATPPCRPRDTRKMACARLDFGGGGRKCRLQTAPGWPHFFSPGASAKTFCPYLSPRKPEAKNKS